jgi:hypothetical protein
MTPIHLAFRHEKHRRVVSALALSVCAAWLAGGCIYNNTPPAQAITLDWIGATSQPVSPAPTMQFALSAQLADTSVDVVFSPPFAGAYDIDLNATRDTLTLSVLDMLQGNTTYVLKLKSSVHSTAGAWLYPYQDSVVFTTAAREQEPNGTFALADTLLAPVIYGMISDAQDTDVYLVPAARRGTLFVSSADNRAAFLVFDSLGRGVAVSSAASAPDTFTIPDSVDFPVYIKIFGFINGMPGMYQFGILQR